MDEKHTISPIINPKHPNILTVSYLATKDPTLPNITKATDDAINFLQTIDPAKLETDATDQNATNLKNTLEYASTAREVTSKGQTERLSEEAYRIVSYLLDSDNSNLNPVFVQLAITYIDVIDNIDHSQLTQYDLLLLIQADKFLKDFKSHSHKITTAHSDDIEIPLILEVSLDKQLRSRTIELLNRANPTQIPPEHLTPNIIAQLLPLENINDLNEQQTEILQKWLHYIKNSEWGATTIQLLNDLYALAEKTPGNEESPNEQEQNLRTLLTYYLPMIIKRCYRQIPNLLDQLSKITPTSDDPYKRLLYHAFASTSTNTFRDIVNLDVTRVNWDGYPIMISQEPINPLTSQLQELPKPNQWDDDNFITFQKACEIAEDSLHADKDTTHEKLRLEINNLIPELLLTILEQYDYQGYHDYNENESIKTLTFITSYLTTLFTEKHYNMSESEAKLLLTAIDICASSNTKPLASQFFLLSSHDIIDIIQKTHPNLLVDNYTEPTN